MTRGLVIWLVLLLTACGGGSGGSSAIESEQQSVSTTDDGSASANCSPDCFLSASDVEQVIGQAVAEAAARNVNATIAVVDRVGNVLGVYQMNGSAPFVTITSTSELGGPVIGGLESLNFIPATLAAVSKAMTGAYLSTTGNAFTTRPPARSCRRTLTRVKGMFLQGRFLVFNSASYPVLIFQPGSHQDWGLAHIERH
jgi:uncharacterized protein GlcG (DUF336 family)